MRSWSAICYKSTTSPNFNRFGEYKAGEKRITQVVYEAFWKGYIEYLQSKSRSNNASYDHSVKVKTFCRQPLKKPTTNLDELRQRATKFMQMEEFKDFRNQVRADDGVENNHNEKEGRQQYRRVKEGPRGQKFPHYTPLNTNRA